MTLRNIWFGFLILLFAAVVTGRTTSANSTSEPARATGGAGGAGATARCSVDAGSVKANRAGDRMVASGSFRCSGTGMSSFDIAVSLQRQAAGGNWTVAARQNFSVMPVDTGSNRSAASRTREVAVPCQAGAYRTMVEAVGVINGQRREYLDVSRSSTNPCA